MGAAHRKIISFDQAAQRLLPSDLNRIKEAFRSNSDYLTVQQFHQDFQYFLPLPLIERIFQVFSNHSRCYVNHKEFVVIVALIFYGSRKERIQTIFSIFCNGEDFDAARTKSFLNECGEQLGENSINFSKIQNEQDFSQFIENLPKDSCRIVDWLLDENLLEKISKRNVQKPFDRDTVYAAALKMKPEEIRNFRRIFEDLLLQNNSRYLTEFDAETFQRIFQPFFTAPLSERIFSVFDENRDGFVDFKEFIFAFRTLTQEKGENLYRVIFQMFDVDSDGIVKASDFKSLENFDDSQRKVNFGGKKSVKIEEFVDFCGRSEFIGDFCENLVESLHIGLNIRGKTLSDESRIIKNFVRREKNCFSLERGRESRRFSAQRGAVWFLIPMKNWEKILAPSARNSTVEIDNVPLVKKTLDEETFVLKDGIRNSVDFESIPRSVFLFLRNANRIRGSVIIRKVSVDNSTSVRSIDVFPFFLKIFQIRDETKKNSPINFNSSYDFTNYFAASLSRINGTSRYFSTFFFPVSNNDSTQFLAEQLAKKFRQSTNQIRLWFRFESDAWKRLDFQQNPEETIRKYSFNESTQILVEIQNNDSSWPEELYDLAKDSQTSDNRSTAGLVGLTNLGNTCFLNAPVQCLSHSPVLRDYFLNELHFYEINKDNPIGAEGHIAVAFGQLLKKLWSSTSGPMAPFELRDLVTKFGSSRFTEFEQHDAQEFLSFLLDGLHEDLNRITKKEYVEMKDSDDRTDEEVAAEYWNDHLARNQSIIVDLFHGLLRSTVHCRRCSLKSVRFEPFNIVPLPILAKKNVEQYLRLQIKIFYDDGSEPKIIETRFRENETVAEFFQNFQITNQKLIFCEQRKKFGCLETIELSHRNDSFLKNVFVEEVLAFTVDMRSPIVCHLTAIHRRSEAQHFFLTPISQEKDVLFGQPVFVAVHTKMSHRDLYLQILRRIKFILRNTNEDQEFPFVLKFVDETGRKCTICPWNRFCSGCAISPDNEEFYPKSKVLAIEWSLEKFYFDYLEHREHILHRETLVDVDSSKDESLDSRKDQIQLKTSLELFVNSENLDQNESFFCKRCKTLCEAEKKLDFWKFPNILIFQIKRFHFSSNRWIKSSQSVRFPIHSFDISPLLVDKTPQTGDEHCSNYDLYGLVCHYGSINGGHYVAFIKNQQDGQWFCFDDSSCTQVSESAIEKSSSSAYLLFYQRVSIDSRKFMPNIEGKQRIDVKMPSITHDRNCAIM